MKLLFLVLIECFINMSVALIIFQLASCSFESSQFFCRMKLLSSERCFLVFRLLDLFRSVLLMERKSSDGVHLSCAIKNYFKEM